MADANAIDQEFDALKTCLKVLEPLEPLRREFVLTMVVQRLGIPPATIGGVGPRKDGAGSSGNGTERPPISISGGTLSPKDFMESKKPSSDVERVVCLAYYLANYQDSHSFKTSDLTALNHEARGVEFSNISQAAKMAEDRKLLGGGKKGNRRLTSLGEKLVEALPDREAVEALSVKTTKKKKPAKKKKPSGK